MKHSMSVTTAFSALFLLGSAIPSQAASLYFSSALTGGDVTTATPLGPNDVIQAYTAYLDTMTVSGAPTGNGVYKPLYLNEFLDPINNIMYITGSVAGMPGLAGVTTLVTVDFAGPLTANTSGGGFSLNFPSVLSITISSTLLADLGLKPGANSLFALTDGVDIGGNPGSYTSVGPTLGINTSTTPEPGTWLMTALGSGVLALVSRKRFSKAS